MLLDCNNKQGFTLLELSMVLVIIGLIIGGVLVGRDLIRAAENRAFVSQIEKYNTAVNTFKLKFNCIPGDCANATDFFTGTSNGDGNGLVTGIGTCCPTNKILDTVANDGTDNNAVQFTNPNGAQGFPNTAEPTNFWHQLQSAGLVGDFTTFLQSFNGAGPYSDTMPQGKNGSGGITVSAWNGNNYYHTGVTAFNGAYNVAGMPYFTGDMSPTDAAYIFVKMGGDKITLGNSISVYIPDAILTHDRFIPSGDPITDPGGCRPDTYYCPPLQGTGGANASVCIDTSVSPVYFNVKSSAKLCNLIIRATF